ncbi:MAG: hypothetical protein GX445_03015 [Elusimicrobia bacterium]|nr:hypothetical protein [Elusimicrobiota bacterium]
MNNIKNIYFPTTLRDFSKIFKKNSSLIAGSTYFFNANKKNNLLNDIIAITELPLKYIKKDKKNIRIGSLVTFDDIENNDICKDTYFGFLSHSASNCSSQLIRNMATIGGNIAHPNAFNIMPLVIETLNGKIKLYDGKKYTIMPLTDYYNKKLSGIITEIILPLAYDRDFFYFEKIAKTSSSWESYITFSFRASVKNKIINDMRLVFGAITSMPLSSINIEKKFTGKEITKELINDISKEYSEFVYNAHPSHKYAEYRKNVVMNTISEFFSKLSKR